MDMVLPNILLHYSANEMTPIYLAVLLPIVFSLTHRYPEVVILSNWSASAIKSKVG